MENYTEVGRMLVVLECKNYVKILEWSNIIRGEWECEKNREENDRTILLDNKNPSPKSGFGIIKPFESRVRRGQIMVSEAEPDIVSTSGFVAPES